MDGSIGDHGAPPEGNYAVLIVQDNGTGIFKEDLAIIFRTLLFQKSHGQERIGPVVYLKKPYGLDTLVEAVGEALGDEPRK